MNKIKVRDFVNAYAKAVVIDDEIKNILMELMENIITKYEKIVPYIPASIDDSKVYLIKSTDGKYSVEDFFLNRLMRNVLYVTEITKEMIDEGFADPHNKGQYVPTSLEVSFNITNLKNQVENYKNKLGNNYDVMKEVAFKKVIMHEFEHALQTRFDNGIEYNVQDVYKKICYEIHKLGKYNNIKNYEEIEKEASNWMNYISTGAHLSSNIDRKKYKTYRDVSGYDNLNEILNETESLEMSQQKSYLSMILGTNGNMFSLRNPESSNGIISNYGDMFKIVFGSRNSFKMMYLKPEEMFQIFNRRFNDIFQKTYASDKDAIELFINAITKIKSTNDESEHLKLHNVLINCLEKRILHYQYDPNVSNKQMLDSVIKFEQFAILNEDKEKNNSLYHIKKLNKLKRIINSRKITYKDGKKIIEIMPIIPTYKELKSLIENYIVKRDGNSIKVIDRQTGKEITDISDLQSYTFAKIWFSLCQKEKLGLEKDPSDTELNLIYNYYLNSVAKNLYSTGNIDSVEIFKNANQLPYNYSQTIIANLFNNSVNINFIEKYFRSRIYTEKSKTKDIKVLHNLEYAKKLVFGDDDDDLNFGQR